MFDPTIFDNLKVVLEGAIYDLDLDGEIIVTNRADLLDLATMSRRFSMQFQMQGAKQTYPVAEIIIFSSLRDFATEMIDGDEKRAGCVIEINFYTIIDNVEDHCQMIEKAFTDIWDRRPFINQEISFKYGRKKRLLNKTNLNFERKINENQIDDLKGIVEYSLESLAFLTENFDQ
ncbi:hypothetical protein [Halalkalibacter urbisdiaboli]|uniref:hypothetical protein n=1 Tax=Halalkalibacter urbisdiaboli TaxID=1960589 RepID=UPI000B446D06|nr:hypothetical protein [Halalkalibacter urbisdiaboli]